MSDIPRNSTQQSISKSDVTPTSDNLTAQTYGTEGESSCRGVSAISLSENIDAKYTGGAVYTAAGTVFRPRLLYTSSSPAPKSNGASISFRFASAGEVM